MSGSVRTTLAGSLVGAYSETEQEIDKVTLVGAYSETEKFELRATLVGLYVEVQEDELIYETVILPEGVGVQYQNMPILTLTRR
jgi:hypothetical protein